MADRPPAGPAPSGPLLLHDARLPGAAEPLDVLVDGGVVAAVGPAATAAAGRARPVPLDGRWLLPGLWDEHVHFTQWALMRRRLDVAAADSAAAAAAMVRDHLAATPPTAEPLVGYGFRDGLWADDPTVPLLDGASGERPVVLVSADLHCLWLNSAARAVFGVAATHDAVLREDAAFAVTGRLTEVPDTVVDRWAAEAAEAAAARGVVGVVDLEMTWNPPVWARRVAAGLRSLRVETGTYPADLDRALAVGLRTGDPVAGGDGLITVGPFKILIDGSLNTRTACCRHPYPDGTTGWLTVPPDELLTLLRRAVDGGLLPAVHAIGDAAAGVALDTFAQLGSGGRIEHAQLVDAADLPRFAALGVVASMQPEHAMDDRDVADRHWAGRTGDAFPVGALWRAGARLAFGSDAPVSPLDPWRGIAAAVSRSRDGLPAWHPEQGIPVTAALDASSRGGRVAPGRPADLVVVDRDPLGCTDVELRTMPVTATLLAGRLTAGELPG
ncbi:amidohydrolase [Nakamurella deserti]|uniref:amidohydrolase n=1 Tax=Nakamurella deserti TaxID=2164074 RepID=UPI000DBE5AA8|nr:amidohydrolase family protein [Nakamurella deserti]